MQHITATSDELVIAIAQYTAEIQGEHVKALQLQQHNAICNYFIIATISSINRMHGIAKNLSDYFFAHDIEHSYAKKNSADSKWTLIECGTLIIHLMSEEMRNFYELEKLYYDARILYASPDIKESTDSFTIS